MLEPSVAQIFDEMGYLRGATYLHLGMSASLWESFEKRYGVAVWEFYSGTGAAGAFVCNPGRYPQGSIRRPWAEYEAKIVESDGYDAPSDSTGYLVMRPVGAKAVVRYYEDAEASASKSSARTWEVTKHAYITDTDRGVVPKEKSLT
jgi:acyl-coenzyme A synthetase/AMP-(fatty) acid ligase